MKITSAIFIQALPENLFLFLYLADGSSLSIHEIDEELKLLLENSPEWDHLYLLPYETIRKLNIPSINMGV
ncbi:hypothetical protein [Bacillus proteolyticus]|uniref:hypothetical protein n=1 Tax=Bacillus proteolyticus TaxID=2026192 RepID=UPI0030F49E26